MIEYLPKLLQGALISLEISLLAACIGIVLGTILGIFHQNPFVKLYVTLFRGTPMLVQIMFIYYLLPEAGINLPAFAAAVVAIGLNSAAYISQIVQTGIQAIPTGQSDAAKTLGFTKAQTMQHIVIPQAFPIVMPALGNELITLIKDSSLASVIGVMELTKEGSIIRSQTYDAFTILLMVSAFYLAMTTIATYCLKRMTPHVPS